MKRRFQYVILAFIFVLKAGALRVEQWRMQELAFQSATDYAQHGADEVLMDVVFTHAATGTTLLRPAFWDGENKFLVRFAPTHTGQWKWHTSCPQDASLNGHTGQLECVPYGGALDIYRHGFLRAEENCTYLMYADGTPFFYLGDTHWGMYTEEIDEAGPHAGEVSTTSHFSYIVNRRAEQGFTVYQSEPIGAKFSLQDGRVDEQDIEGFRLADRYYRCIADAGLVHANAEFFFAATLGNQDVYDIFDVQTIDRLSRYWVARFGAWPVLWTLAQEIDNDFYHERGDNKIYDAAHNPWVRIAEALHRHDTYSHPLSGHQENTWYTTVSGAGTAADASDGGASAFQDEDMARRVGHNWWAVQWQPDLNGRVNPLLVLDYWCSNRPAILYESRYCDLWTKDFGARAQGWIGFLSGFAGYGYGAIDMWLYKSTYDIHSTSTDGRENITPEDKAKPWCESVESPSALQMRYLRSFMEDFDWWNLRPLLPGNPMVEFSAQAMVAARTDNRLLLYFYGDEKDAASACLHLHPLQKVDLQWFNTRSGQYSPSQQVSASQSGELTIPPRPDAEDWIISVNIR